MSLNKPLADITIHDLQNLVADREAEKQTVDYKKTLMLDVPQNKDEFRRDISSFANASGGDYILGVREEYGFPIEVCGMTLDNPDAFKLRLEELLQTHIRPRIPGVQIRPIELSGNAYVTIIRVPRSFARPHQVTANKDDYQFWSRNAAGKYRLDVDQLRNAFLLSEALEERVRSFRRERLGDIIAGETPVPMSERPKLVFHLVPLNAFEASSRRDLSRLTPNELNTLWPLYTNSMDTRYNFDGTLNFHEQSGIADSYVQLFRSGIIEAVEDRLFAYEHEGMCVLRATHCGKGAYRRAPQIHAVPADFGR